MLNVCNICVKAAAIATIATTCAVNTSPRGQGASVRYRTKKNSCYHKKIKMK